MRWDLFWAYKDTVAAEGERGFGFFSLTHLLWLAAMIAGVAVLSVCYRRCGETGRDNLRKVLALFLILFEITKQCVMALTGAPNRDNLPLEICSFAEYVILIDTFWPKNRFFKQMLVFAFLPAAVMALALPTVTVYPPVSFYTIHQFLLHGVIVAYVVVRYAAGEIRPRYVGIWLTIAGILALVIPMFFLDRAMGANFMFLTGHENNPALRMIWNVTGEKGGFVYVLGLAAFVTLVIHGVFGIYALLGALTGKKREKKEENE